GSKFAILRPGAQMPITGEFAGLTQGQLFSVNSGSSQAEFQITYPVYDGNDVVLTAIDVSNPILQGTADNDAFAVKRNGDNDDISLNGTLIWSTPVASLNSLTIDGAGTNTGFGADTLTVDSSAGD